MFSTKPKLWHLRILKTGFREKENNIADALPLKVVMYLIPGQKMQIMFVVSYGWE
jgi:hypothetical protein